MKTVIIETVYWGIEITEIRQIAPKDLDKLLKEIRAKHVQHLLDLTKLEKPNDVGNCQIHFRRIRSLEYRLKSTYNSQAKRNIQKELFKIDKLLNGFDPEHIKNETLKISIR